MRLDCLDDLVADPVERVQARKGILEDHREVLAADLPELAWRKLEQVLALEEHLPRDVGGFAVGEAERGQAGHALARAGLAHDAEGLSPLDREGQAVDRLHDAVGSVEMDAEVLNLEEGFGHISSVCDAEVYE